MTVRQIFNVNHASTPRLLSVNRWIFVYNDISLIHSKVISVFKLNWILIKISGTQLNRCWNLFMGILRIKSEKFKCWLIEFIVYRIKQMPSPDEWIYINVWMSYQDFGKAFIQFTVIGHWYSGSVPDTGLSYMMILHMMWCFKAAL